MKLLIPQNSFNNRVPRTITKVMLYCPNCGHDFCEQIPCTAQVKLLFWVNIKRYRCCNCDSKFHRQVDFSNQ